MASCPFQYHQDFLHPQTSLTSDAHGDSDFGTTKTPSHRSAHSIGESVLGFKNIKPLSVSRVLGGEQGLRGLRGIQMEYTSPVGDEFEAQEDEDELVSVNEEVDCVKESSGREDGEGTKRAWSTFDYNVSSQHSGGLQIDPTSHLTGSNQKSRDWQVSQQYSRYFDRSTGIRPRGDIPVNDVYPASHDSEEYKKQKLGTSERVGSYGGDDDGCGCDGYIPGFPAGDFENEQRRNSSAAFCQDKQPLRREDYADESRWNYPGGVRFRKWGRESRNHSNAPCSTRSFMVGQSARCGRGDQYQLESPTQNSKDGGEWDETTVVEGVIFGDDFIYNPKDFELDGKCDRKECKRIVDSMEGDINEYKSRSSVFSSPPSPLGSSAQVILGRTPGFRMLPRKERYVVPLSLNNSESSSLVGSTKVDSQPRTPSPSPSRSRSLPLTQACLLSELHSTPLGLDRVLDFGANVDIAFSIFELGFHQWGQNRAAEKPAEEVSMQQEVLSVPLSKLVAVSGSGSDGRAGSSLNRLDD